MASSRPRIESADFLPRSPADCLGWTGVLGSQQIIQARRNARYSHSRENLELNFLGLPIRPGKRECPYYMRKGSCKYASNCRFNHPDPTATGGSDPPSGYGNGGPASLQGASQSTVAPWSAPRPLNEDPVYSTLMIPPPQVVSSQNSEWNGYQASAYAPEKSMPARPPYMMNNSVAETNVYKQHPHQNQVEEFPERPGQPLCSYFLRTGDCRFKSNCKYHHPKTHCSRPPIDHTKFVSKSRIRTFAHITVAMAFANLGQVVNLTARYIYHLQLHLVLIINFLSVIRQLLTGQEWLGAETELMLQVSCSPCSKLCMKCLPRAQDLHHSNMCNLFFGNLIIEMYQTSSPDDTNFIVVRF